MDLCELSHVEEVEEVKGVDRNKSETNSKAATTTTTKTYPARVLLDPKFYENKKDWKGWSLSALHNDPDVFRLGKHENLSVHLKNVRLC